MTQNSSSGPISKAQSAKNHSVFSLAPWILWAVAVFFIFYQFILRTSLGVMGPSLIEHWSLSGAEFSALGSLFYYGYAGMQIPSGVLLDHFGPRAILPLFLFLCVLGICLFSFCTNYEWVLLGRLLTGIGSSGAFIGTVKTTHALFEEKKFKNLIGISVSFALVGAIYGGLPIAALLESFGLIPVLHGISYVGLAFFLLMLFLFPNPKFKKYFLHLPLAAVKKQQDAQGSILDGFRAIFKNRPLLGLIGSTGGLSILLYVFADQWGPLYLIQYHHISLERASSAVSFIYTGMMIGATALSLLATRFRAHKFLIALCGFLMPVIILTTLLVPNIPLGALVPMMLTFGVCASLQILFFSLIIDYLPKKFVGTAIGFSNMTIMVFGSMAINLSGFLIDFFHSPYLDPKGVSDAPFYPSEAYQFMLGVTSGISLVCVLTFLISAHFLRKNERRTP